MFYEDDYPRCEHGVCVDDPCKVCSMALIDTPEKALTDIQSILDRCDKQILSDFGDSTSIFANTIAEIQERIDLLRSTQDGA